MSSAGKGGREWAVDFFFFFFWRQDANATGLYLRLVTDISALII